MSRNSFSRSGERSPRSRSVGARSSAGSRRSRTSGSVLRAKSSSRLHRRARLAQEGREHLEGLGQRVVARGERREGGLAVRDQAAQLPVLARDRVEHAAGVAHDPPQRHLLLVERPQQVGAVLEERRRVAERVVEVAREASPEVTIPASCSHSWKSSRVSGSKTRKTSSSSTVSSTFERGSVPPSARSRRLGAARRELHVGLAQQALLAQDRARVAAGSARSGCRSRSRPASSARPGRAPSPSPCRRSRPAIRTSASFTSSDASGNAALKR